MSTPVISSIISIIIGSTLLISGIPTHTRDILAQATSAVNGANLHQLATVIELYYSDHDSYPNVSGGEALVNVLESEDYIQSRPLKPSIFEYEPKDNGQEYILKLKEL